MYGTDPRTHTPISPASPAPQPTTHSSPAALGSCSSANAWISLLPQGIRICCGPIPWPLACFLLMPERSTEMPFLGEAALHHPSLLSRGSWLCLLLQSSTTCSCLMLPALLASCCPPLDNECHEVRALLFLAPITEFAHWKYAVSECLPNLYVPSTSLGLLLISSHFFFLRALPDG